MYAVIVDGVEVARSDHPVGLTDELCDAIEAKPDFKQAEIKRVVKGFVPACGHKVAPGGDRKWCGVMECLNYINKHNSISRIDAALDSASVSA